MHAKPETHRPSRKQIHPGRRPFVLLLCAFACLAIPSRALAELNITFQQVGANVVETGTGSIDTAALTDQGPGSFLAAILIPNIAATSFGPGGGADQWTGTTGPSAFGSGGSTYANTSTGTVFGLDTHLSLILPTGYTSGSSLSGTDTFTSQTFSSLGITPGTYTYTWGTGATADSLIVQIGPAPAAVPEPATIWFASLGGTGFIAYARFARGKKQRRKSRMASPEAAE
jgi:hypothetical protein